MREAQENRPSRLRKLLVAAGIVIVTVGCLQIALHIFEDPRPTRKRRRHCSTHRHRPFCPKTIQAQRRRALNLPAAAVPAPASPRSGLAPGPSQAVPTEPAPPVTPVPGASDAGASDKSNEFRNSAPDASAAAPPPAAPAPPPLTPRQLRRNSAHHRSTEPTGSLPRRQRSRQRRCRRSRLLRRIPRYRTLQAARPR